MEILRWLTNQFLKDYRVHESRRLSVADPEESIYRKLQQPSLTQSSLSSLHTHLPMWSIGKPNERIFEEISSLTQTATNFTHVWWFSKREEYFNASPLILILSRISYVQHISYIWILLVGDFMKQPSYYVRLYDPISNVTDKALEVSFAKKAFQGTISLVCRQLRASG